MNDSVSVLYLIQKCPKQFNTALMIYFNPLVSIQYYINFNIIHKGPFSLFE